MDYGKKLREALVDGNADYEVTRWIEQTFPELKEESEDERIRGKIIATIHLYYGEPLEDEAKEMIAWLEKQGEQKPVFEMKTPEESLGIDSDTYNKIVDECIYGEQKPAGADLKDIVDKEANSIWKEINTSGTYSVIYSFNQFYGICIQVAEAVVDYQKPAWSEEDDYTLNETIQHLEELIRIDIAKHCGCDVQYYQRDIDWLKSLKDRVLPQSKLEWSEEDEVALDDALWCCKQAASIAKDENDMGNVWYAENWLESIKDKYTSL